MEVVGYIGGILLALCGIPEATMSVIKGRSGVTLGLALMWWLGEIATLAYVVEIASPPLLINYITNIVCTTIIVRYKIWPRNSM